MNGSYTDRAIATRISKGWRGGALAALLFWFGLLVSTIGAGWIWGGGGLLAVGTFLLLLASALRAYTVARIDSPPGKEEGRS